MNYITCRFEGRLGNQMFQIAHVLAQSRIHARRSSFLKDYGPSLAYQSNIFRDLPFDLQSLPGPQEANHLYGTFHYSDSGEVDHRPTVFHGFYQSEKYFQNLRYEIKRIFSAPKSFVAQCQKEFPFLRSSRTLAVNVRRGDYLRWPSHHPVVTAAYIHSSLNAVPDFENCIIVSDDIEWCKANLQIQNAYYSDYYSVEALWLLSLCNDFIISNSTFSWWGAYLSSTSDSRVVAPSTWFGPAILETGICADDIYCPQWRIMPTRFKKGEIVPI